MWRRVGDKTFWRKRGRKDIATPAAADENLASTVPGALDQRDGHIARRGERRGDETCSAGADNEDHAPGHLHPQKESTKGTKNTKGTKGTKGTKKNVDLGERRSSMDAHPPSKVAVTNTI
jgi:hypothetical protein